MIFNSSSNEITINKIDNFEIEEPTDKIGNEKAVIFLVFINIY